MLDFESVFPNTEVKEITRITLDIYGGPGTWKSGLSATFEEPIIVINFDRPWEHIRSLFPDKYISVKDIGVIGDLDEFTAVTTYNQVKQYFAAAMQMKKGTIVIDGGTQFWTLLKMVILAPTIRERQAKGKDLMPFDNDKANAEMHNLMGRLSRSNLNVVFIHQAGNIWATDESGRNPQPTDRQYAKESSVVPYESEVQIYTYMAPASDKSGEMVPWCMITACKLREAVIGMKFEKPTFEKLAPWILPL